jgi:hypothetical protein
MAADCQYPWPPGMVARNGRSAQPKAISRPASC